MVVRLKDLDSGQKKSGVVRLSDLEPSKQPDISPVQKTINRGAVQGLTKTFDTLKSGKLPEIHISDTPKKSGGIPILDALNDNVVFPVSNFLNRAATSAVDALLPGDQRKTLQQSPIFEENARPAQTGVEKAADIVGSLYGSTPAIMGAYGTGGRLAASALGRLAPNAGRIAQNLVRGAGAGLAYGTASEAIQAAQGEQQSIGGRALDVGKDALLFGGGDAALSAIGKGLQALRAARRTPELEQSVHDMLSLPPASRYEGVKARSQGTVLPTNESPIYGQGDVHTFALPEGNYIPPTRLKVESNPTNVLGNVLERIKPEVESIITPPKRRDLLIDYVQTHLGDVPKHEVWNMPMKDLQDLGQSIRQNISVHDIASQVARKHGYDLPGLLEGKVPTVGGKVAQDAQKRVYGVYPASLPRIQQPAGFNTSVTGEAAGPVTKLGLRGAKTQPGVEVIPPKRSFATEPSVNGRLNTQLPKRIEAVSQTRRPTDELRFAQTVKESQHTSPELVQALNETPIKGGRTSDVLNRQQAAQLLEKHGQEGLYSKLLAKRNNLSSAESTAAQMLAKHYSSAGGKENMQKAIELVSKTAREGREMGQAIQALSQWNKLDETGALLLGERQLNRGLKNTEEWKSLTPAQAQPIQVAAQRIEQAQQTKSLADEVLSIVTSKKPGEALTDAEKDTIKQFQDQVKQINEKTKPFLPKPKNAAQETVQQVQKVPPKERTRDQVVDFLEAKAELARKRLAQRRNIGIMPNIDNPVLDYAIIGASHIAKGIRTFTDYSEMMVKDFGQSVKPHLREAYLKSVNMFRKENGLPTVEDLERTVNKAIKSNELEKDTADSLKIMAHEIGFMADKNLKLEATQELQLALRGLGTSTLGQKLSTLQTGAQLLNAVTVARNVVGNGAQIVAEKMNKMAAVPIDWTLSKFTGERTIQFMPQNQESMMRNFLMGTKSGYEGVSPTGTLSSYDIHPEVFGNKNPLKYVTKLLGASMQGFDLAAYRQAYGDVVATYAEQMGKAQGLTKAQIKTQMPKLVEKLDANIHDLADQAGLYATFQDETLLSQGAQMLKHGLNKLTDIPAQSLVERGLLPKSLSTEGFGLGDIVLKYARTPANLVMRGIDYSPIGFVRATMELAPLFANKSKFNQFAATRALSRAITGTLGLTGMGYVLANAGVLTGSSSMDKDVRSIQEQSGQGAYKVNWSALGRFVMGGLDKNAAKYQKGDTLMDYAWMQPAAISLAMGVNANKAMHDKKQGDTTGWQQYGKALLGGLATVLENPMVQGVSNVVDAGSDIIKKQDATKLKNIGKGVPASFVPTLFNQSRAATDNNQRETFDKNLLTEMGNLMKNKVPGLSKTLPISYDSMGNAREKIQGGQANTVGQYLTSFFSPAKITEYQVSPEAKIVLDLMNESGDQNTLPRIEGRYIHIDQGKNKKDLKVDLTAQQYSQLQRNVGQLVTSKLSAKSSFLANPNVNLKSKVDAVKTILTDAGKKAREDIGTQMGYKKTDVKK